MKYPFKVYVGCSLTHAPKKFRDEVENFKNKLREICEVLDFYGLADKDIPREVYEHDIHNCVGKCDLLLAICDFPSLGLGWELGTQVEKEKSWRWRWLIKIRWYQNLFLARNNPAMNSADMKIYARTFFLW